MLRCSRERVEELACTHPSRSKPCRIAWDCGNRAGAVPSIRRSSIISHRSALIPPRRGGWPRSGRVGPSVPNEIPTRSETKSWPISDIEFSALGNFEVDREFDGVCKASWLALETEPHPAAARPPSPEGEG